MTVDARRARFKNYIEPHIGAKAMTAITPDDLRPIVTALDEKIRERTRFYVGDGERDEKRGTKPGLASKTAWNIWGEVTSGFEEAYASKLDELRVRKDNPAKGVRGPDHTDEREQAALYPSELTMLLACEQIPHCRRVLWAVAAFAGLRMSECAGLRVRDIDFEHGVIRVRRQKKHNEAATARMKTKNATRDVAIMPALEPLLHALVEGLEEDDALLKVPPREDCAELVRVDLLTAGCDRDELHTDDESRMHFTAHGLRHTCITHWAVAGKPMFWIMGNAGHGDPKVTQRYVDMGANIRAKFGEPHPLLPASILVRTEIGQADSFRAYLPRKFATPMGIEPMLPA